LYLKLYRHLDRILGHFKFLNSLGGAQSATLVAGLNAVIIKPADIMNNSFKAA